MKIVRHNCNKKGKTILVRVEQFKIWQCTFKVILKNNSLSLSFKDLKEANLWTESHLLNKVIIDCTTKLLTYLCRLYQCGS